MSGLIVRLILPISFFFLQEFFWPSFFSGALRPNFLLCLSLSWGLVAGPREGLVMGAVSGLLLDLNGSNLFGLYCVGGMILGWAAGAIRGGVYRDRFTLPVAVFVGGTIFQEVLLAIFLVWGSWGSGLLGHWFLFLSIQVGWNLLIILPVYGIVSFCWHRFCDRY